MHNLNKYGSTAGVTFYRMPCRPFVFLLTPIFGLMRAPQPAMGINFGAKQYDRAISSFKIFASAAFILMFPFWLLSKVSV